MAQKVVGVIYIIVPGKGYLAENADYKRPDYMNIPDVFAIALYIGREKQNGGHNLYRNYKILQIYLKRGQALPFYKQGWIQIDMIAYG